MSTIHYYSRREYLRIHIPLIIYCLYIYIYMHSNCRYWLVLNFYGYNKLCCTGDYTSGRITRKELASVVVTALTSAFSAGKWLHVLTWRGWMRYRPSYVCSPCLLRSVRTEEIAGNLSLECQSTYLGTLVIYFSWNVNCSEREGGSFFGRSQESSKRDDFPSHLTRYAAIL